MGPTNRGNINDEIRAVPVSDTGTANAYAVSESMMGGSYYTGMPVVFTPANTNTGASTINVNSIGTKTIKKQGGTADVVAGDIQAGAILLLIYDGTNFQVLAGILAGGNVSGPASSTASDFAQFDGTTGKLLKDGGISLDTDGTLAANSDLRIASQKAVKTFVDTFAPGGSGSLVLQTNGVNNSSQGFLNLTTIPSSDISESAGTVTIQLPFPWGGDGSDGSVTFDGSSTVLGLVPSSSIYTLTRDIFCVNITINSGASVKTGNFAIFCTGTLTVNGVIRNNGTNGSGGGGGTSGGGGGTGGSQGNPAENIANGRYCSVLQLTQLGGAGGAGGTGAGSQAPAPSNGANQTAAPVNGGSSGTSGANGGAGGTGVSAGGAQRNGGGGGTVTVAAAIAREPSRALIGSPMGFSSGQTSIQTSTYTLYNGQPGTSAGGSGGGGDGTNPGGGGGAAGGPGGPGGFIGIFAKSIVVGATGSITSSGGNGGPGGAGGSPTAGNTGGGGGGAGGNGGQGGTMWLVYQSLTNSGTIACSGGNGGTHGAGGTAHGTGVNGSNGSDGNSGQSGVVVQIKIS